MIRHKARNALAMASVYRRPLSAWWNRLLPYNQGGTRPVEYRLRDGSVLSGMHGPEFVRQINAIWIDECYGQYGFEPSSGLTFMDVGANRGLYTVWAAARSPLGRFILVEPNPRVLRDLERNLTGNGLSERTDIWRCAMGDASSGGQATLYVPLGRSGQGSLRREEASREARIAAEFTVEVTSFGEVVRDVAGRVDFMKIDIEGLEYEMLLSTSQQDLRRVRRLVVEHFPTSLSDGTNTLVRMRAHLGAAGLEYLGRIDAIHYFATPDLD